MARWARPKFGGEGRRRRPRHRDRSMAVPSILRNAISRAASSISLSSRSVAGPAPADGGDPVRELGRGRPAHRRLRRQMDERQRGLYRHATALSDWRRRACPCGNLRNSPSPAGDLFNLAGYARVDFRVDAEASRGSSRLTSIPASTPTPALPPLRQPPASPTAISSAELSMPRREPQPSPDMLSHVACCASAKSPTPRPRRTAPRSRRRRRSCASSSRRCPTTTSPSFPSSSQPLKHRFVSRLFVAENARDQTLGVALLLYAPDIGFSYLEIISTALGRTGRDRRHAL